MPNSIVLTDPPSTTDDALATLRERVCRRTGHHELVGVHTVDSIVVPNYASDNGLDEFVDGGIRLMIDRAPWATPQSATESVTEGDSTLGSKEWSFVEAVEGLTRVTAKDLLAQSTDENDEPAYWALVPSGNGHTIYVWPPSDGNYSYAVRGSYYPTDSDIPNWLVSTDIQALTLAVSARVAEALDSPSTASRRLAEFDDYIQRRAITIRHAEAAGYENSDGLLPWRSF